MTLKEKFGKLFMKSRCTIEFEQIADEFAVQYAEWCCARAIGVTYFKLNEEELEQFKKEKGL